MTMADDITEIRDRAKRLFNTVVFATVLLLLMFVSVAVGGWLLVSQREELNDQRQIIECLTEQLAENSDQFDNCE